jgi:DNA-binding XRE family transcriptional regulator
MSQVGATIRSVRKDAGLSQAELAVRAGTSQPALARYEIGATLPTLSESTSTGRSKSSIAICRRWNRRLTGSLPQPVTGLDPTCH